MTVLIAITRQVSPGIEHCELTHLAREPINLDAAKAQHQQYESCLEDLGCEVRQLPTAPDLPDSVFVEDTAIVLDELAVMMRPGAASRRPETRAVAEALTPHRRLFHVESPGVIDGGDVLRVGKTLYVGLSSRSDQTGVEQLRRFVAPFGYTVIGVPLSGCLHLKSAVTQVARETLLANRDLVDVGAFGPVRVIDVHPAEPFGGNALLVGETVIYPAAYAKTRGRMEEQNIPVKTVDVSELAKAEGGVTCCSLIFRA